MQYGRLSHLCGRNKKILLEEEKKQISYLRSIKVNSYVFIGTGDDDEDLAQNLLANPNNRVCYADKYDSTEPSLTLLSTITGLPLTLWNV